MTRHDHEGGATSRTLRVGIATLAQAKARTMAIARGEITPGPTDPKVWFPTMETLGKILSGRNQELLAQIRMARPDSLQALAALTGRHVPNLSRTLKTMERYGLVTLTRGPRGKVRPELRYDEVDIQVQLGQAVG